MQVFDRIDPKKLDRHELQLRLLALTTIFVLTVGVALLMYPSVFSTSVVLSGHTQRKAFFGFCALGTLLLGYLIDRQAMVNHLRKALLEQQETVVRVRHEASADILSTLPGFAHFQDRLTMEYRRAATTQHPLSLIIAVLKSAANRQDQTEISIAFGEAARVLMRKLRGEDSIYLFSAGVFCIVLPSVTATNAYLVSTRLADGLQAASGGRTRFSFQVQVFNYPEHAKSARELEEAVRPFIPKQFPGPSLEG
jgi:GGDEF domain-containing protein